MKLINKNRNALFASVFAAIATLAGTASAALPTEWETGLEAAGTTLAGYVISAAAIGIGVFVAMRGASLVPAAIKKLMH